MTWRREGRARGIASWQCWQVPGSYADAMPSVDPEGLIPPPWLAQASELADVVDCRVVR